MDVIVWNMRHKAKNWELLSDGAELAADVHLVCEAPRPPKGIAAIGQWGTVGLEAALPLDKPVTREWSTGVASRRDLAWITDARIDRQYGEPLPFKPSRPGTWTAGSIKVGKVRVTTVALYGLMDELSDASVHRSLSEMAPLFDHSVYGKHLMLGGDLNILANPRPNDPMAARHLAVLERIRSYGLRSCLGDPRLPRARRTEPCPCERRGCRHRRTFRKSAEAAGRAYEEDFLFVSKRLADRLESCEVLPFRESSDHAPLRARFGI